MRELQQGGLAASDFGSTKACREQPHLVLKGLHDLLDLLLSDCLPAFGGLVERPLKDALIMGRV
jgi:hypothetical protein